MDFPSTHQRYFYPPDAETEQCVHQCTDRFQARISVRKESHSPLSSLSLNTSPIMATDRCIIRGDLRLIEQMPLPWNHFQEVAATTCAPPPSVKRPPVLYTRFFTLRTLYFNDEEESFQAGSMVTAYGHFIVQYREGIPILTVSARDLTPLPVDYFEPEVSATAVQIVGTIRGSQWIDSDPGWRLFTVILQIPHFVSFVDDYVDHFEIHCAIPNTIRWQNVPLPEGRRVFVNGHLIGIYKLGSRSSPLIVVTRLGRVCSCHRSTT